MGRRGEFFSLAGSVNRIIETARLRISCRECYQDPRFRCGQTASTLGQRDGFRSVSELRRVIGRQDPGQIIQRGHHGRIQFDGGLDW